MIRSSAGGQFFWNRGMPQKRGASSFLGPPIHSHLASMHAALFKNSTAELPDYAVRCVTADANRILVCRCSPLGLGSFKALRGELGTPYRFGYFDLPLIPTWERSIGLKPTLKAGLSGLSE